MEGGSVFRRGGPVTDYKDCVGEGWSAFFGQMDAELRAADPDYQVAQVKEKFGGLRVYLETYANEQVEEVIRKYELIAWRTCENCGKPGTQTKTAWILTLCPECSAAREERRRQLWKGRAQDG